MGGQLLSVRDAWLLLAEAWRNTQHLGQEVVVDSSGCYGLCGSITNLYIRRIISEDERGVMQRCVHRVPPRPGSNYCWTLDIDGAKERVKFCLERSRLS